MKTKKILSGSVGRPLPAGKTLWTIQPVQVWHKLLRQKSLHAQSRYIRPEFREAYDWLVPQMKRRVAGYSGRYPWWAYEHRPDIRYQTEQIGFHVLLQLSFDPARVLLRSYAVAVMPGVQGSSCGLSPVCEPKWVAKTKVSLAVPSDRRAKARTTNPAHQA